MSPGEVFTPLQLDAIRQLFREEMQGRAAGPALPGAPELLSPEEASRRLGGHPSADTIRSFIHRGLAPRRLAGGGKVRPSYLLTIAEVLAALEANGKPVPASAPPVDLEAVRARARGKARGGR